MFVRMFPATDLFHPLARVAPQQIPAAAIGPGELPTVLVLGPRDPEFQQLLEQLAAEANLLRECEVAAGSVPLALLVLLTPRPIGFASRTAAPELQAAQRLEVCGSWCEGSRRVTTADPAAERIYWHEFPGWWRNYTGAKPPLPGFVEVAASDYHTAAAAIDTLADMGCSAFWRAPGRRGPYATPPAAGLWIGGQLNGAESRRLAAFAAPLRRRNKPLVVALDFPRVDELETAQRIGATAVVGRPWTDSALAAALGVQSLRSGSDLPVLMHDARIPAA